MNDNVNKSIYSKLKDGFFVGRSLCVCVCVLFSKS